MKESTYRVAEGNLTSFTAMCSPTFRPSVMYGLIVKWMQNVKCNKVKKIVRIILQCISFKMVQEYLQCNILFTRYSHLTLCIYSLGWQTCYWINRHCSPSNAVTIFVVVSYTTHYIFLTVWFIIRIFFTFLWEFFTVFLIAHDDRAWLYITFDVNRCKLPVCPSIPFSP